MSEIIKKLDEMIDILEMDEDEYLDYHKKKYEPIYKNIESDYSAPYDTYMHRTWEVLEKIKSLRSRLESEK